jgi:prephenate dehydrogenase
MLGVLQSNRENVIEVLSKFRTALDEFETALRVEDDSQLEGLLDHAAARYADVMTAQ